LTGTSFGKEARMTADEIQDLNRARASLARQRNAIARRIGGLDVAPISMSEDLTRTLVAIEAVDRALVEAGQPHVDIGPAPDA
jgi:predicted component of type VI protein secretion system